MSSRSNRFVIHFAILFLVVLLLMFALFHFMRHYDGRLIANTWLKVLFPGADEQGGILNFAEAFRVNLFLIDLSLILIVESLLIYLFLRYTVPAVIISSAATVALVAAGRHLSDPKAFKLISAWLVRNEYAALGHQDVVLLFMLNALLLAFMVAMMHHYHRIELHQEAARTRAAPGPTPPPGAPQGPPEKD